MESNTFTSVDNAEAEQETLFNRRRNTRATLQNERVNPQTTKAFHREAARQQQTKNLVDHLHREADKRREECDFAANAIFEDAGADTLIPLAGRKFRII